MDDEQKAALIERAKDGIGAHLDDDWKLRPSEHTAQLPKESFAGLKNILSQTPIKNLMKEYEEFDDKAVREQARYMFREKAGTWLFFLALAIGAFSLLPLDQFLLKGAVRLATFCQFVAIFVAFTLTIDNLWNDHFNAWHSARAKAELARGALFRETLNAEVDLSILAPKVVLDEELPLVLQKLEYARRYHIELQYAYYRGRGKQHINNEQGKRKWLFLAGAMAVLAAIPMLILGVEFFYQRWGWFSAVAEVFANLKVTIDPNVVGFGKVFLALGTFAAGLKASIANVYRINNDIANSMQYHHTAQRLAALYTKHLRRIRGQAVDEKIEPVRRWFQCCNGLILDEHRKWQQARTAHLAPLTSLEELSQRAS